MTRRILEVRFVVYALAVYYGIKNLSQTARLTFVVETRPINTIGKKPYHYNPSTVEQYFIDHAESLGLLQNELVSTCPVIVNETSPVYDGVQKYFEELDAYNEALKQFQSIPYDLRGQIKPGESNIEQVCNDTKLHPDGLQGIFKSLSLSSSNRMGGMEPLLPTLRSHKICSNRRKNLISMEYLVHDFYSMCKTLKRHSRLVFVDMGASLEFHRSADSPAVYINKIFSKFGFHFDHIYAYEITQTDPAKVYERVPDELMASFHWINVGVDPEPNAKMNPFTTLLEKYDEDDFVVVKLDIDNGLIENKLALQLKSDKRISKLVDLFYYEHHVLQQELMPNWAGTARGSVGDSMRMMAELRAAGVAAHYWP